jgi:2'-5' RNA ligase
MRTALVVPIPEAESLVGDWRRKHDPSAADGMPAHVTVLYPFRTWEQIDADALTKLERLFGDIAPFDLTFAAIGRFAGVRWLAPEPRARIDALTKSAAGAFPDCKPYGGAFADPAPHLTFAIGEDTAIDAVERAVQAGLVQPIRSRVENCVLYAFTDDGWREQARFCFTGNA